MATRQITPFFSSTFSALFVKYISEYENTQNPFSYGRPFLRISFVEYLNFCPKATDLEAHHTFLGSRHPEVTLMFCPTAGAKYPFFRLQLMD